MFSCFSLITHYNQYLILCDIKFLSIELIAQWSCAHCLQQHPADWTHTPYYSDTPLLLGHTPLLLGHTPTTTRQPLSQAATRQQTWLVQNHKCHYFKVSRFYKETYSKIEIIQRYIAVLFLRNCLIATGQRSSPEKVDVNTRPFTDHWTVTWA